MMKLLTRFANLLLFLTLAGHAPLIAKDRIIDGVPIPVDASPSSDLTSPFSGSWVGAWGGSLKHIMFVEKFQADGEVTAIYAIGEEAQYGIRPQWYRLEGQLRDQTLRLVGDGIKATYRLARSGALMATYERGRVRSLAVMRAHSFSAMKQLGKTAVWTNGVRTMLQTELKGNDGPVQLESIVFKPKGTGPFPLAIMNHGSTGRGNRPQWFQRTWSDETLAALLTDRGWLVAFVQRRGRGRSDGLYDEGFSKDRSKGYTCKAEFSLAGAARAIEDVAAAVKVLRKRKDVDDGLLLIGGQSRGGALAVAYTRQFPEEVSGVLNFVGGWLGEGCSSASKVNQAVLSVGARFKHPMLWIYGVNDPFYSIDHSRENYQAFRAAGGRGEFLELDVPGGNGHAVLTVPHLWTEQADSYLKALKSRR